MIQPADNAQREALERAQAGKVAAAKKKKSKDKKSAKKKPKKRPDEAGSAAGRRGVGEAAAVIYIKTGQMWRSGLVLRRDMDEAQMQTAPPRFAC